LFLGEGGTGWVKDERKNKVFDKENGFPPHPHQAYCLTPFKSFYRLTSYSLLDGLHGFLYLEM
jgi:hypothetical protein